MRKFDWGLLALALVAISAWTAYSGIQGYKGSNAVIVSKSISVRSTIDGQIDSRLPQAGSQVEANDFLVRITNERIDQSRLTAYESELKLLMRELGLARQAHAEIGQRLAEFDEKARSHTAWMLKDIRLRQQQHRQQLVIADNNRQLKENHAKRLMQLYSGRYASNAAVTTAQLEVDNARQEHSRLETLLTRDQLLHQSLEKHGAFFDNGDASYWGRMVDELALRKIDSSSQIALLESSVARMGLQIDVERQRIATEIQEEHVAPFTGIVSATSIVQGSRITAGTELLQLLDCANPVVIVPIPGNRMSQFAVGQEVTIYPVDTDAAFSGVVEYISSGPLLGHDQTLLLQDEITISGMHAVVGFSKSAYAGEAGLPCEAAHSAVVMIHTDSAMNSASSWLVSMLR